ncbi:protein Mdm4 isoform X7 [Esox lucius]|uniref:protein Mdm4 isoform X7 n=1 Tax=Esox lucius TaxID=8010 RepID=UPI0009734473|nr:protein Mdm4 isoform X7 [Esox lucius]
MTSLPSPLYPASTSACRILPGEGSQQVQPKAPLLQILRVAGAKENIFTFKEVMHHLGQYIMGKQLYDKQRQHIVHCQDDPLGELLEVDSFSVKNPSPVYEMLKKYLVVLNCSDAAESLSLGRECVEGGVEERGQVCVDPTKVGLGVASDRTLPPQTQSQRRPRESDEGSLDGLPRSACKRPKLDVSLDEWDLSGLPWWFLGNLRNNYSRRSNGSTDIHTNQDEDTAIVSDTTDDLWFLTEGGSEQVSVEMKEAVLEEGSGGEVEPPPEEEEGAGKEEKADKEMQISNPVSDICSLTTAASMQEEPDEDSQCLSDDTDTEISTQDAWQCTECRKYNSPLQRYCVRCWALRKNWYRDVPRLVHSLSVPDIPACSSLDPQDDEEEDSDAGIDVPDCLRSVSDPIILPSHSTPDRPLPPGGRGKGKGPRPHGLPNEEQLSGGESQESLGMEVEVRPEALLEPCKLCRIRPRNGSIIHGRTAHLLTCFSCARRLHKFHAPCPGCGQIIQKVIKTFIA